MNYGKKVWVVPDGYLPVLPPDQKEDPEVYFSHESTCIINLTDKDAKVRFTVYFEDKDPVEIENITVGAKRSNHVRMERLLENGNSIIGRGNPYSLLVESSEPVVVQMSRLDTTQDNMAFLATMAYPLD